MNIFILSNDPIESARMQCDKHVVKMTLESCQLLSSAFPDNPIYKHTHLNHPCSIWTRESIENYYWLFSHALALTQEYRRRYGKTHACMQILERLAERPEPNLPDIPRTQFALAMPVIFKNELPIDYSPHEAVDAYRRYYRYKSIMIKPFTYTNADMPDWLLHSF